MSIEPLQKKELYPDKHLCEWKTDINTNINNTLIHLVKGMVVTQYNYKRERPNRDIHLPILNMYLAPICYLTANVLIHTLAFQFERKTFLSIKQPLLKTRRP